MILSIIIPMYNCEKYIRECLDSLTRQNFNSKDYEIIIVNDGSTDTSRSIAIDYCKHYKYFNLIDHEKNQGVSESRNTGLKRARGKYVAFIDADDYVSDNLYSSILKIIIDNNFETFYFGYATNKENIEEFQNQYYMVEKEESWKPAVWRYIYTKDIIIKNSLFFKKEIRNAEDMLFNYKYLALAKSPVYGCSNKLYFYRQNPDSLTGVIKKTSKNMRRCAEDLLSASREVKCFSREYNLLDNPLYQKVVSSTICSFLWASVVYNINIKEVIKSMKLYSITFKDIVSKPYEGKGVKMRAKSSIEWTFRYKFFFKAFHFLYNFFR